jgi:hypothetical protein
MEFSSFSTNHQLKNISWMFGKFCCQGWLFDLQPFFKNYFKFKIVFLMDFFLTALLMHVESPLDLLCNGYEVVLWKTYWMSGSF